MPDQFADRLSAAVRRTRSAVCVGLDPRPAQLPAGMLSDDAARDPQQAAAACGRFCREVVDAVADLVPIVKPQAAFFEQFGPAGMQELAAVVEHASRAGLLVIMDAKRNDIGSTAEAYADGYLGSAGQSPWGADALTISPYLGSDSLTPFVDVAASRGAGLFVLVKTSNPGGGQFQDLVADGKPLYEHVAEFVEQLAGQTCGSCGYGAVGAVVGATYPEQLASLRKLMPRTWLLVPGYGSQGAGAADVAGGFDEQGLGAVVNNSRALIFAQARQPYADKFGASRWQEAVAAATRDMNDELRAASSVGRL